MWSKLSVVKVHGELPVHPRSKAGRVIQVHQQGEQTAQKVHVQKQ